MEKDKNVQVTVGILMSLFVILLLVTASFAAFGHYVYLAGLFVVVDQNSCTVDGLTLQ
jgi:hypothetical protein